MRIFAVTASCLMLFVVVDTAIVKAASTDRILSPQNTDNGNGTPSPPPMPAPPEQPQRDVSPGTVTQGWENSTPVQIAYHRTPTLAKSHKQVMYETAYGNFFVTENSPYFVGVSEAQRQSIDAKFADSAFLVMYEGAILLPANGIIVSASSSLLILRYDLLAGPKTAGTMHVTYSFYDDRNKISISFVNSIGIASDFQIVWLTFTTWDAVDTAFPADIEQKFSDLQGYFGMLDFGTMGTLYATGGYATRDGRPGAAIRPYKSVGGSGGVSLQMDVFDADSEYGASYAGKFTFGAHAGNAVLSTFLPGRLSIDPALIVPGSAPSTATAYSLQRKTFYDGQRYWLFYQSSTTGIGYVSTVDGQTWGTVLTAVTAGGFQYGFTVINYGKTVAVLWRDTSGWTRIHIRTGLIAEDAIMWDEASLTGHELQYPNSNSIDGPVSATFAGAGHEIALTWHDDGGRVGYTSYQCAGPVSPGFSSCSNQTAESSSDYQSSTNGASMVVAFNGDIGVVARLNFHSGTLYVKEYLHDTIVCSDFAVSSYAKNSPAILWQNGLFTAVASGPYIAIFDQENRPEDPGEFIWTYHVDSACRSFMDNFHIRGVNSPTSLTVSATPDGGVSLFFVNSNKAYLSRMVIPLGGFWLVYPSLQQIFSAYNPTFMSSAESASHFIPLAFTTGAGTNCSTASCVFYSNYPLPLDGEAAVTNPWATKLGAPLVTEVGGTVSPTTGLLAVGQPLVQGTPAISIIYREPGLFNLDGTVFSTADKLYQIIPGIYYDFPWISSPAAGSSTAGTLHMPGGQTYALKLSGQSGSITWFNITSGIRYTVKRLDAYNWVVLSPAGATLSFHSISYELPANLTRVDLDSTGQNYITYTTTPGSGMSFTGTIKDASLREIDFSSSVGITSYGNGQSIVFTKLGMPSGCTGILDTDSQTLRVKDALGRTTTYYVCKWKLTKLESPNGGRVGYTYASTPISQGTDAYSYPLTLMDIYNESAANVTARSQVFNWVFQNGEVVRALVNTTDKSGAVQGSNEYIFNSAAGTASVRVFDSAGQVLYYDMATCTASPCGGSNLMKDLSGNANHGTFGGSGGSFPYGKYGKAGGFGGAAWIQGADAPSLDTSTFSISVWLNPTVFPTAYNRIVAHDYWTNSQQKGWTLLYDGTSPYGRAYLAVFFGGVGESDSQRMQLSLNSWNHVAVTFDGKNICAYLNGALAGGSCTIASAYVAASGNPLYVGAGVANGLFSYYTGKIDEVRIFSRYLSSEDVAVLYSKNALKRGEQQNWYSINDQPHLAEGFVGDETTASVVTQDAIDDWGNQIYHRNALGNETFASYANTNHQNHFYAPGRLTKNTGTQFNTEFIDFSQGTFPTGQGIWWTGSVGTAQIDYTQFDKITPSLKMTTVAATSNSVYHALSTPKPRFIEFKVRLDSNTQSFQTRFEDGSGNLYLGIMLDADGKVKAYGPSPYTACTNLVLGTATTYLANTWYRVSIQIDWDASNHPFDVWFDGTFLACGTMTLGNTASFTNLVFYQAPSTVWSAWVDDIKIYDTDCKIGVDTHCVNFSAIDIGFDGLQLRQSVRLVAEDGSVIDQNIQTNSGPVWLRHNNWVLWYPENGDNSKTTVQIYAEDGTLEYQSPLTRFFVGEKYTYTRPRTFADELIKTRSGALNLPNLIYADEHVPDFCTGPNIKNCRGIWNWVDITALGSGAALRGNWVDLDTLASGWRWHGFELNTSATVPNYFVSYVWIPEGKSPSSFELTFYTNKGPTWVGWGGYAGDIAPVPNVRNQWVELVVSAAYLGLVAGTDTWTILDFSVLDGQLAWDVTTTQTDASLTVSGLSSGVTVGVYYTSNGTQIATAGESSGSASVALFNSVKGIAAFPLNANIKIYDAYNEYYFGPARNIWPGDSFRYIGASSFFDSKSSGTVYWPSSTIHTAVLGSKTFSGDCLDALLCDDMETLVEGATSLGTGAVQTNLIDLSGHGNLGQVSGTVETVGAAGLALQFNGGTDIVKISPALALGYGSSTVSAWVRRDSTQSDAWGLIFNNDRAGQVEISNAGVIIAQYFDGTLWHTLQSVGTVPAAKWTHVAATFYVYTSCFSCPYHTQITIFINGVADSGNTFNELPVSSSLAYTSIGSYDGTQQRYKGSIDQLLVYGSSLNSFRVLALYHSRMPGALQTYLRPNDKGFPITSRVPYEGTYLYAAATYDSRGNVLSVTDVGRTPPGIYSGIAVDASSDSTASLSSSGGTMSWTHTSVSIPSLVTVACDTNDGTPSAYTVSATYGGTSMTAAVSSTGVTGMTTTAYYLNTPGNGAKAVAVTVSGAGWSGGRVACSATTWTGTNGVDTAIGKSAFNGGGSSTSQALGVGGTGAVPPNEIFFSVLGRYATPTTGTQTDTISSIVSASTIIDNNVVQGTGPGHGCILAGSYAECIASAVLFGMGTQITWSWTPTGNDEAIGFGIKSLANVTGYEYSALDGNDYRTKIVRPDGKEIYAGYDLQSGVKYGTVGIDCRRSRTQYDAMVRPTQTSVYDTDSSEVLHLDMETATYSSLKDISCAGTQDSRLGQTVTSVGGTAETSGPDGMSRNFGSGGSITVADASSLAFGTGSFTISLWAYLTALPTSGQGRLIIKTNYPTTWWTIDFNQDRTIEFESNIGTVTSTGAGLTVGQWRQITVAVDRTAGKVLFYFDGVLDSQPSVSFSGSPDSTQPLKAPEAGGSGPLQFNGKLDEIRAFKTALSAPSIADLRNFRYKLLTSSSSAYDDIFPTSVTTYDGISIPRALFFDMEMCITGPSPCVGSFDDLSGHGNDGVISGAADVAGKIGRGRQFSVASDKVRVASPVALPLGLSTRTISAWVKPTTTSSNQYVVAYGPASASGDSFGLGIDSSGKLIVDIYNGRATSTLAVGTGAFHFVAAVYSGGSQVTMYVDGSSQTVSFTGTATTPNTAFGNFIVGQWASNTNYNTFNGIIDEVHLIWKGLSATEISDLFNSVEKSHVSKTYSDGLGRNTRTLAMDMFGKKVQTVVTLGWNDKPIYSFMSSGQYSTFSNDFLGRTLTAQSPGDSTISGIYRTIVSEKARMIESIDTVGRKAYSKTDLLGRTIETGVWNPRTGTYGNLTAVTYNALSEITSSKDAKGQTTTMYYNSLGKTKMSLFPDGTYSLVYYDDNLRAFESADVMGRVSISAYDNLGRVTSITLKPTFSSSTTYVMTYGYDSVHDDLLTIDNTTAKITRTYDSLHRMKTEKLDITNPLFTGTISYGYDNASKVTNITYPVSGSPKAVYTYDTLGRPIQVDYNTSKYAVLTYDSFGRLDNIHYWKGAMDTTIQEKYTYDAQDRITQVKVFNSGSTIYMQLDYTYNKASEIISSIDNMYVSDSGSNGVSNPKTITYTYDGNGRIASAVGPYGASQASQTFTWVYDKVGNLQWWNTTNPTASYAYTVSGWNRLDSFSLNSMSFSYNTAGSMACKTENGSNTRYVHDFLQRLVAIRPSSSSCTSTETPTYTYQYDGLGRRVYDSVNGRYFMYSGSKLLYTKGSAGAETAYVYLGGRLLLQKEAVLDTRFYHLDVSAGNVRLATYYTTSVQVDAKYRYKPFGDILILVAPSSDLRFKFAQQDFDAALRLYHMGARYYDPLVGRFIQRDPIGSGYSYASNNPISAMDPSGMFTDYEGQARNRLIGAIMLTVVMIALAIPTSGGSLALYAVIGGLIGGVIAVAIVYQMSGGRASAIDYVEAFSIGFAVGAVIGSVYGGFRLAAAGLAAGKASLPGVASDIRAVAASTEARVGRALLVGQERELGMGVTLERGAGGTLPEVARMSPREETLITRYMGERALGKTTWVRYEPGGELVRYEPLTRGAFEINKVNAWGFSVKLDEGAEEITGSIGTDRTISLFMRSIEWEATLRGAPVELVTRVALRHELAHAVGIADEDMAEAVARISLGLPPDW